MTKRRERKFLRGLRGSGEGEGPQDTRGSRVEPSEGHSGISSYRTGKPSEHREGGQAWLPTCCLMAKRLLAEGCVCVCVTILKGLLSTLSSEHLLRGPPGGPPTPCLPLFLKSVKTLPRVRINKTHLETNGNMSQCKECSTRVFRGKFIVIHTFRKKISNNLHVKKRTPEGRLVGEGSNGPRATCCLSSRVGSPAASHFTREAGETRGPGV